MENRKKAFEERFNLALTKLQDTNLHNWSERFLLILESLATPASEIHYIFAVQKGNQIDTECVKIGYNELILAGLSKYIEQEIRQRWVQEYLDRKNQKKLMLNKVLDQLKEI